MGISFTSFINSLKYPFDFRFVILSVASAMILELRIYPWGTVNVLESIIDYDIDAQSHVTSLNTKKKDYKKTHSRHERLLSKKPRVHSTRRSVQFK